MLRVWEWVFNEIRTVMLLSSCQFFKITFLHANMYQWKIPLSFCFSILCFCFLKKWKICKRKKCYSRLFLLICQLKYVTCGSYFVTKPHKVRPSSVNIILRTFQISWLLWWIINYSTNSSPPYSSPISVPNFDIKSQK